MSIVEENIRKQEEYCRKNKVPFFAPYKTGYCWSCGKQIFNGSDENGYYSEHLITGCPHCHRSFVD